MTQEERLLARLRTLQPSSLYEIVVYVTPEQTIGFWVVERKAMKLEGEQKEDVTNLHHQKYEFVVK